MALIGQRIKQHQNKRQHKGNGRHQRNALLNTE
jgi:hypothetical protein